jgi:hypothetical protein
VVEARRQARVEGAQPLEEVAEEGVPVVMLLSPTLEATAGGRPVLVMCPDPSPGRGSVEMLATLARARMHASAACFLPPSGDAGELVALARSRDVPLVGAGGWRQPWFRARWALAAAVRRGRARWRAAIASGQREMYRELRRQAGKERLPAELRRRLRDTAHRAYGRSAASASATGRYPRRLLREPSAFALPEGALDGARAEAAALGFVAGTPTVLLEARLRPDLAAAVTSALADRGYRVIAPPAPSLRLLLFLLCESRFVICASSDVQQLAYVTNTPSLAVHATDVFRAYPVRANGLCLLRTAVDLDAGGVMPVADLVTERAYRPGRTIGYREHSIAELTAAVEEMAAGVEDGWRESESQTRFRDRAVAAGTALAPLVPSVAAWGPDDGFLGDGRLARIQADRLSLEP